MFYLRLALCTVYFHIRLSSEPSYIAKVGEKVVLSSLYDPIKFKFTAMDNNNISLIDSFTDKGVEVTFFNGLRERPIKVKERQAFKIVYSGSGSFYIMQGNKCLQVRKEDNRKTKSNEFKKLTLGSCSSKNEKFFDVKADSDLIKQYDHIRVHDTHHDKRHLHYHSYDNYCGYHNCSNRSGMNHVIKDLSHTTGHGHEVYIDVNEFYLS
ncbi:hypothetical protein NGRA_0593 [Nosema granulosis]|uniref:Uncharacterized protein n=1 Tax=Nosema granulosis TaxID=83296 RepID=A0A9P6H398_9MICR|nr:hypothetical protein NGRA_0593 [Nosema granulosis]